MCDQRGLDAVEETLQPPDELGLGNAQLRIARRGPGPEGQRQPVEFIDEFGREAVLEFGDGALVDLGEPRASGLVQRGAADLVQQLLNH